MYLINFDFCVTAVIMINICTNARTLNCCVFYTKGLRKIFIRTFRH